MEALFGENREGGPKQLFVTRVKPQGRRVT